MSIVLGAVLVTATLLGVAAHLADSTCQVVVVAGALARLPMFASLPGALLLAWGAGLPGAVVGVATIAAAGWTQLPLFAGRFRARQTTGTPFTVLHANILLGRADAGAIVALVDRTEPDVLTVVELTPDAHDRLRGAGLSRRLPHFFVSTAPGGEGTGIYSRYPLADEVRHDGFVGELLSARVLIPDGPSPRLFAVHPAPPWPRHPSTWARELASLTQLLAKIPVDDGPVVVAGDFNATHDHKRYRKMLKDGYHDAAVEVGAGHLPTYHAAMQIGSSGSLLRATLPPIIAIDHVIVRGATVTAVDTVHLPGSDHRGIRAALLLQPASE